jgi:cytochrome c oxidase subunit 1
MMTGLEIRSRRLVNVHFWAWIVGATAMAYAMGLAGIQGMLRRTLYPLPNQYEPHMVIALAAGLLIAVGFLAFLVNIVGTLGWANVFGLVVPERWLRPRASGAAA